MQEIKRMNELLDELQIILDCDPRKVNDKGVEQQTSSGDTAPAPAAKQTGTVKHAGPAVGFAHPYLRLVIQHDRKESFICPKKSREQRRETAPAEVMAAAAEAEPQQESPEIQVERFTLAATFAPPSANDDSRTIDAVWYTGAKVPRFDWRSGEEYDLVLDMKGCRLDRLNNGGPVLDSHSAYGVESQLGVVRKAWAKKSTGMATLQFSKRDAVTPIWNDVKAGIIQNLSPGMWIYKKVDTTPKGQERKEFTATDWEPFEISLLSVPADAATNFMSAAVPPPAPPSVIETQRASAHTEEKPDMETTTQDPGVEARQNEEALAAARDEAVKAERLRASKIRAIATGPFPGGGELPHRADRRGCVHRNRARAHHEQGRC